MTHEISAPQDTPWPRRLSFKSSKSQVLKCCNSHEKKQCPMTKHCVAMPSPTDDGPELPTNFLDQSDSAARSSDMKQLDAILTRWQSHVAPSDIPFDELRQVLYNAISANQVAVVSLLLKRGAKVEEDIGDAARLANASTDMYQVFLDHGWDVNSRDVRGRPFVQYYQPPPTIIFSRRY